MTSAAKATRSDPTRIGSVRPSHLVSTSGIGAVVDLPGLSVVVRGADAWSSERQETVHEPRLLEQVRRVLGDQVQALKSAPWDPQAEDDPWTRVGVPTAPFPGWARCPACFRLGPLHGSDQFTIVHRWGRRPDLAKIVHSGCSKQRVPEAKRRACVPARFLVVCAGGHLDDFPYNEFVHTNSGKGPCDAPKLRMHDSASTLQPLVTISCETCGSSANIQKASGRKGSENLPICRGRHPHLQTFETCGNPLRMIVIGASNLWFSVTASALHLPQSGGVEETVAANWDLLSNVPKVVLEQIVGGMEPLRSLRDIPVDELWAAIEKYRAKAETAEHKAGDLLDAEWKLLSRPTTEKQDQDFRAIPNGGTPRGYGSLIAQVVRVTRLREVQAFVGFTRLNGPDQRDLRPANLVGIRSGPAKWVPAVEKRGEGIFLEFHEDLVARWERQADQHPRIVALRKAHRAWLLMNERPPEPNRPIARLLLLHTLSHLLIRQVSLECGYSSASIRERLYLGTSKAPTAGLLLSTAASDSEGTLGGLVSLGENKHLTRLLDNAFDDATRCSSDPLCSEHVPSEEAPTLHLAACHACLFVSETSCETNNRWLDRGVLVDLGRDGLVFPL